MIKKSNFVKANDKSTIRSTHPPLETIVLTCQDKKTEVNAISFKISDDRTPITSLIEQPNSTNESLHVIGQQPDHIENTASIKNFASEKPVSIEKALFDLSS